MSQESSPLSDSIETGEENSQMEAEVAAKKAFAEEQEAAFKKLATAKAHLEAVAQRFSHSINADILVRLLMNKETARQRNLSLKRNAKFAEDQVLVTLPAYREQVVRAKRNIDPVTVSNIGTNQNELKIIVPVPGSGDMHATSKQQLTDAMTLYFDLDGVNAMNLDPKIFDTKRHITFIGVDPTLSLDERLKKEEEDAKIAAAKLAAAREAEKLQQSGEQPVMRELLPFSETDENEVTAVRRISDRVKATIDPIPDLEVPPKSA